MWALIRRFDQSKSKYLPGIKRATISVLILFLVNCGVSRNDLARNAENDTLKPLNCNMQSSPTLQMQGKQVNGPSFAVICNEGGVDFSDTSTPIVSATPGEGVYGTEQIIILQASKHAIIYYTLDGTQPTINSSIFNSEQPLTITTTRTLRYFAIDLLGNRSETYSSSYTIDESLPTVSILFRNRTAVSGDTSAGPSARVEFHWTTDTNGTYRIERGGVGLVGSGQFLSEGSAAANTTIVSAITGSSLNNGHNKLYFYLINELGNTGYATVEMPREDVPPLSQVNIPGGEYSGAKDIIIANQNEIYGMRTIYYTTDGSDVTFAEDQLPLDAAGTSVQCASYPYRPDLGKRCRIANSTYTSPIHIEPYLPLGCTPGIDCESEIKLRYFAIDMAGNIETPRQQVYEIGMSDPSINHSMLTSNRVRIDGNFGFRFAVDENITEWQIALSSSKGWDNGAVLESGSAMTAMAEQAISIPGSMLTSGTLTHISIRVKNALGRVGHLVLSAVRDDVAPVISATPAAGSYSADAMEAINLRITNEEDIPGTEIFYTLDNSDPSISSPLYGGGLTLTTGTTTVKFFARDLAGNVSAIKTAEYKITSGLTIPISIGSVNPDTGANEILVNDPNVTTVSTWCNQNDEEIEYRLLIDDVSVNNCTSVHRQADHGTLVKEGTIASVGGCVTAYMPAIMVQARWEQSAICAFSRPAGSTLAWQRTTLPVIVDKTAPQVAYEPRTVAAAPRRLSRFGNTSSSIRFSANEIGTYSVRKIPCSGTALEKTAGAGEFLANGVITLPGQTVNVSLNYDQFNNDDIATCIGIFATDRMGNTSGGESGAFLGNSGGRIDSDPIGGDSDTGWLARKDSADVFNLTGAICISNNNCAVEFNLPAYSSQSVFCESNGACSQVGLSGLTATSEVPLHQITSSTLGSNDMAWLRGYIDQGHVVNIDSQAGSVPIWFYNKRWRYAANSRDSRIYCLERTTFLETYMAVDDPTTMFSGNYWDLFGFPDLYTRDQDCVTRYIWIKGVNNEQEDWMVYTEEYHRYFTQGAEVVSLGEVDSVYEVDWADQDTRITTHSFEGSKVFTYRNPYGTQTALLVDCAKDTGCTASSF